MEEIKTNANVLPDNILEYEDALKIFVIKFKEYSKNPETADKVKNLKEFCETHEISYQAAMQIKNGKINEKYPLALKKMYEAIGIGLSYKTDIYIFSENMNNTK